MTLSKLRPHSSFESIRKQAKKLARLVAADDPVAVARVRVHLSDPVLPISLRDAQLVVAREFGFAGWHDLRKAVLRQAGKGLEWAAREAQRAIHDRQTDRLRELVAEYPTLLTWRDEAGESLLAFAAGSFGDSGDAFRERAFTRLECAEYLLDAGAVVDPSIWDGAIHARSRGIFDLLSRKATPPRSLEVLAALGDLTGVKGELEAVRDGRLVSEAVLSACRFERREVAAFLLDRGIELDPGLGKRVDSWRGPGGLIDFLIENPRSYGDLWITVVMTQLHQAIGDDDLEKFCRWLREDPVLLGPNHIDLQIELIEHATWNDRGSFISRILELNPAFLGLPKRPPSSALHFALEYGNAHLVPLLTPIWPLPDDLPHAAGVGDFDRVKRWFDESGGLRLGSLSQHYPANNPAILRNLRWQPANAQHVLDVALAWSCLNRHFEIAEFLLERGANINTDWSTHEPAGILHECAVHGFYEAARFLIDHGIDTTTRDYRWNGTAEGWAIYAANDLKMAEFIASAAKGRIDEAG